MIKKLFFQSIYEYNIDTTRKMNKKTCYSQLTEDLDLE